MSNVDPWDVSSGLLDDFDFVVKEAWFGTNEKIGEGKRMLLTLRGDAFKDGELAEEEYDLIYTVGDAWEEVGGGASVKNRGGQQMFNENSAIGRLIKSFRDLGEDALNELRSRGNPTDASTWEGLAFHVKRQDFGSFTPKGETEPRKIEVPVATAILDPEDVGGAPAKPKRASRGASKTAAKPATRSRSRAKASDDEDEAPAKPTRRRKTKDLRAEVVEFAAEFEEHEDFVAAVFDADEFPRAEEAEADEELSEEILDPESELWEESRQ